MSSYPIVVPTLRRYLFLLLYVVGVLLLLRLAFWVFAAGGMPDPMGGDAFKAFYIGLRFDARLAALLTLPLALVHCMPPLAVQMHRFAKPAACFYAVLFFILLSVYAMDFGFYAYLGNRLSTVLFELAEDFAVGVDMIVQSYPVVWICSGLLACTALCSYGFYRLLRIPAQTAAGIKRRVAGCVCGFLVFAMAVYGQLDASLFPLRWSNAFFTTNEAIVALALNPVQNLYDTYGAASADYSIEKARDAYPRMARFLGVTSPDEEALNYERAMPGHSVEGKRPNVVIIIMESLSYSKTSFAPGGADATPYLKSLAAESVLFHRFFANARTTARGVFSTITGLPDVNESSTGSRNPLVADQRIVANEFAGYDKYYMIGGSASWANMRAVFAQNIEGLAVLEEGDWKAPSADVWGVSDYDLLMEAHERLASRSSDKPFLAVIQTASFHQPFTIPPTPGFSCDPIPEDMMRFYGFDGSEEYCSMRYMDYALGTFMARAKESPYYENTVFLIFGDHGIKERGWNMPDGYVSANLGPWHVPLVVHAAPSLGLPAPGESWAAASQVDVFPTAAGLAGIPYRNTVLGRDLFDPRFDDSRAAYIGGKSNTAIRLVSGDYCYYDNRAGGRSLFRIDDTPSEDLSGAMPELFREMESLADDIDATIRYMLYNNKKR